MIKKKAKKKKPSAKKKVIKKKPIKKMKTGGDTDPPKGFPYPKSVKSSADSAAYASGYGYFPPGGSYAGITKNANYKLGKAAKAKAIAAKKKR